MATTDTGERFEEWAVWFHQNKKRLPPNDLRKRLDFLTIAVDGLMELMALTINENRNAKNLGSKLFLPKGVILDNEEGRKTYHALK